MRRETEAIEGSASPRKAEMADIEKIVRRQLRRRMALDGERQVVRRHAVAIVGDTDQILAAAGQHNLDSEGTRIERIFD